MNCEKNTNCDTNKFRITISWKKIASELMVKFFLNYHKKPFKYLCEVDNAETLHYLSTVRRKFTWEGTVKLMAKSDEA